MSKMFSKSIVFFVVLSFFIISCDKNNSPKTLNQRITKDNIKVGFVYTGFINDDGYTEAHDAGRKKLNEEGIKTLYIENVSDDGSNGLLSPYEAIEGLIEEGCNVIYSTSYGFMNATEKSAKKHPDVLFSHCSGDKKLKNLSTYYGRAYQARYLSGIVAGLKTKTNKLGYVAAFRIPECIREINAFKLGVQSVNPKAEVYVTWIDSWLNVIKEKEMATLLVKKGCDVISQHQDSIASQLVAQDFGVFCIGFNFQPKKIVASSAFLTAAVFHWDVFYWEDVQRILNGTWESRNYWDGVEKDIVGLSDLSDLCEPRTAEYVEKAKNMIKNGKLKIFSGELFDNEGKQRLRGHESMTDDEIWNMDWFVKGVFELN